MVMGLEMFNSKRWMAPRTIHTDAEVANITMIKRLSQFFSTKKTCLLPIMGKRSTCGKFERMIRMTRMVHLY